LPQQILWNKFHIRCAYFTSNCTWSPNYSVLVDCAAKRGGVCLNDFLTQGPQVMNERVVKVMHHFWRNDYAMTGDIKEMFLQVLVPEEDRDYLLFLIYKEDQLLIYRWKVHLFGKTDSPCVATMAVFTQILKEQVGAPTVPSAVIRGSN
jgi:hypothetical protein